MLNAKGYFQNGYVVWVEIGYIKDEKLLIYSLITLEYICTMIHQGG